MTLHDLTLAIPHEPKCIAGYVLAAVLLIAGLIRIRMERRAARAKKGGKYTHITRA